MDTILKQLYEGELNPGEQYYPVLEEYKKLRKQQCQHYQDFLNELNRLDKPFIRPTFY